MAIFYIPKIPQLMANYPAYHIPNKLNFRKVSYEQGENLDVISDELIKTTENMIQTNKNLDEASSQQKKAKKKYKVLVFIIILIIVIVAGVLFFTLK